MSPNNDYHPLMKTCLRKNQWIVFLSLLLSFSCSRAHAQSSEYVGNTPASKTRAEVIVAAVVKQYNKALSFRFNATADGAGGSRMPAVILVDQAFGAFGVKTQFAEFEVLTEDKLVDRQIASFIYIKQISADEDDVMVEFDMPSTARFGTLRISAGPQALAVKAADMYRSSSGSRSTYGRLYQSAVCRNGSEMAHRWNYYDGNKFNGKCPAAVFPEAEAYLADLARRKPKP